MSNDAWFQKLSARMKIPVIVAPMFLVSGPELVVASAKAGVLGCMPAANARTLETLKQWFETLDNELRKIQRQNMWGVNLIVHESYDRFDEELELIEQYQPKLVITALGSPKRVLEPIQAYGGKVLADVITVEQARKSIDLGVDGLILVCSGAGGHTGRYSPFAFVEEVRRFYDGPLIVGGAIQSARTILAVLALGADCAYIGTRFISCPESLVNDDYRDMLVRAQMSDIVTSEKISGVQGNWLKESLIQTQFDIDRKENNVTSIDFSNIRDTSKAWKNIWSAGHGVGATKSVETVKSVVDALQHDFIQLKDESCATHILKK